MNRSKFWGRSNLMADVRHPSRRDGVIALALFLLPWVIVPFVVQLHHHLDGGMVAILVAVSLGLPTLWVTWAAYRGPKRPVGLNTTQAADELAIAVGTECEAEARVRRLNDPYPLPVSWNVADPSVTDDWDSLVKLATSGVGWPAPAPTGTWAADPNDLGGKGGEIVDVLARVPTGRLVVLGEPGTGKTMLMIRLVLDLLARRASGGPVPILASVASWNPETQDLRSWLCAKLLIGYPALADAPATGRPEPTQAQALLASGMIIPILDGLDEIPEDVRGPAISEINDALRPGEYLVVTCRTQQYRDAVRPPDSVEVVLTGAAAIQLRPLNADDVRHYLCDDAAGPAAKSRWDGAFQVLEPGAPAWQALSTPLMVGLARAIYNPRPGELTGTLRDPAELCSPALADRTAVEAILIDEFIPAAYRQEHAGGWHAQDAERWLIFLARHLEYTIRGPDLSWWQLARSTPRIVTGLATGLIAWLVTALAIEIALVTITAVSAAFGLRWFAVPTVGMAAFAGLKFAPLGGIACLLGEIAAAVTVREDQPLDLAARWNFRRPAVSQLAVGTIIGLMVAIAAWFWYQPWLAVGLGIIAAILAMLSGQHAHRLGTSPDFRMVPVAGIVVGTMVGLTFGIVTGVLAQSDAEGLRWGIAWGVMAGLAAAAAIILKGAYGARPARGAHWNLRKGLLAAAAVGSVAAVIGLVGGGSAYGLSFALIFGLTGGIAVGVIAGMEGIPDKLISGASPMGVLVRDRGTTLLLAVATGISAGIAAGVVADVVAYVTFVPLAQGAFAFGLAMGISTGLTIGAGFGLAVGGFGSAWPRWLIARGWMTLAGRLPPQLITFLEDAYQRGVLRQVGAVYQFRHIELQHRLAKRNAYRHQEILSAANLENQFLPTVFNRRLLLRVRLWRPWDQRLTTPRAWLDHMGALLYLAVSSRRMSR
jgi:hypothetical protein